MVRRRLLLAVLAGLAMTAACVVPAAAMSRAAGCTQLDSLTGACETTSGSINGDGVDLRGHHDAPGHSSDDRPSTGNAAATDGESGAQQDDAIPAANRVPHEQYGVTCGPPACVANSPTVHLSDLAHFHPAAPSTVSEPNGWAVVGLDANFIADAPSQVLSGTLLAHRAQVRFTPVQFHWSYGDGSARTTGSPGATWTQLRLPEFSPTVTSHVYRDRGTFTAQLTVGYSPEFRLDGGSAWTRIDGLLRLSAARFTIVTGDADTVLVGRDCVQNPRGPGC